MTNPRAKPPCKAEPAKTKSRLANPPAPIPDPVPLGPVAKKIGEAAGNLKARSAAFKRRQGPSGK